MFYKSWETQLVGKTWTCFAELRKPHDEFLIV